MNTKNSNNSDWLFAGFRANRTITPLVINSLGTLACNIAGCLHFMLEAVFGDLAGSLPVAFRAADAAANSKDLTISLPGSPPRPVPPNLVRTYEDHSIRELREQAARSKATRGLADKLSRIPAIEQLAHGCCLQPAAGQAQFISDFQPAHESYREAFLLTRDAGRLRACQNAGYRIVQPPRTHLIRFVNAGGSTGSSREPHDAALGKIAAHELGLNVSNDLFVVMPSCNNSVNPSASRAIAGKLLVELARAQESPEKIVISLLNNQKLRWTSSPIYNTITIVSITDEFRAAGSRSEICARLATLALAYICTTTLQFSSEQFADCQGQADDGRYGLPIWRRLGFGRCFVSQERNSAIIREAMLAEANRIL